jgi:hypothetical protein
VHRAIEVYKDLSVHSLLEVIKVHRDLKVQLVLTEDFKVHRASKVSKDLLLLKQEDYRVLLVHRVSKARKVI